MVGKRQGMVVEADDQLLYGSRGFMIRSWRMEVEDRQVGMFVFTFLGGVETYLESYLANCNINTG